MTRPLALLALALAGCVSQPRPGPWTVQGGTDDDRSTALAYADAALRVMPDSPLSWGGTVILSPDIATTCYGPLVDRRWVVNGCALSDGVVVRWPLPGCSDLSCSALPHEICHVGQGASTTEIRADACALLVVQEYRRGLP